MKCGKIQKLLSDGELSDAQRKAVDEHLEQCADCRRYRAQLEKLATGFVPLFPSVEPRSGFAGRTLARIENAGRQTSWLDRALEFVQPAPAALAAASLALGILLAIGLNGAGSGPANAEVQDTLFAEFFDITPFDSLDNDAATASENTER